MQISFISGYYRENIVIAIFYDFSKSVNLHFYGHDQGIAKIGTSKHVKSSKDWCFTSGENICEHTIVWFKIVVECKEDVFFWGIRSTAWLGERERAVVFIQYLYLDDSPTYGRETKTNEVCWPLINWTKGRSHQGVLRFRVRRYFTKSRLFVVCILFCSF